MSSYPLEDRSMLGPPPWKPDDPRLQAWEAAHGHDVRLDCDVQGCVALIDAYEAAVEALERVVDVIDRHWTLAAAEPSLTEARAALVRLREGEATHVG